MGFLTFIVLLGRGSVISAEEISPVPLATVNLQVTIKNAGIKIPRAQLQTLSFQTAYYKLRTGKFTKDDKNSSVWQSAFKGKDEITITNNYKIGEGIEHTEDEAIHIIELLFKGSYGFLGVINESGVTYSGSPMHSPGNSGLNLTNNEGVAEAKVSGGVTAVVLINSDISNGRLTSSQQLLDVITIGDKDTELAYDKTGYETTQIGISVLDLTEEEKRNSKTYVVEYGQQITYHIAINKMMLTQGAKLTIAPQSNIVIDSITMPSKKTLGVPSSLEITSMISYSKLRGKSKEEIEEMISEKYVGKILVYYDIEIPESDEDVFLDITVRLAPEVGQTIKSTTINGVDYGPVRITSWATKKYDENYSMKLVIKDKGRNDTQSIQTPQLSTTGINFVIASKENLSFVRGAKYVIGKVEGKKKYIYSNDAKWISFDEAKEEEFENSMLLQGGHEFYLGDTNSEPTLNVPYNYWESDGELSTTINQSVINLRGLAQNQKYFLYQVVAPTGYEKNEEPYYFEAWSKDEIAKDGAQIINSSVSYAKIQEYGLNGSIPSYKAGSLEFNVIYVDATYKQDNAASILIWVSFILFGFLSIFIVLGAITDTFDHVYHKIPFKKYISFDKIESKLKDLTQKKTKVISKEPKKPKKAKKQEKLEKKVEIKKRSTSGRKAEKIRLKNLKKEQKEFKKMEKMEQKKKTRSRSSKKAKRKHVKY
ncbi:MAG: hypothetical protein ACK5LM_07815 [Lactovum sp.]